MLDNEPPAYKVTTVVFGSVGLQYDNEYTDFQQGVEKLS